MKTIEYNLRKSEINLTIDNKTKPKVILDFLKRYTNDRLIWKKTVQDIMAGNR